MAINKLKIMLSFMREINDGNIPTAKDYEISNDEYCDIIEACQNEGLIKGAVIKRAGYEKRVVLSNLTDIKLTVKGMEYLDNNSAQMKAYRGLKELREWLPF